MAKEQTDNELNLRRKARRRLIGAIALTLAVVVVLPMVLDSEPKPTGKDIDLRIPAPDKVGEFAPASAASGILPPAVSSAVVASVLPVVSSVSPPAAVTVDSAKPAVTPKEQVIASSGSRTEVQGKIQPVATKQSETKVAESKSTESKAVETKTPDVKIPASQKPDSAESYVAQVGAYSSAAAAKQELDKLKKWGFKKAYTEKAGDKIRVRVGPYAERDKAEQVRHLLEKHGLHPVVANSK